MSAWGREGEREGGRAREMKKGEVKISTMSARASPFPHPAHSLFHFNTSIIMKAMIKYWVDVCVRALARVREREREIERGRERNRDQVPG